MKLKSVCWLLLITINFAYAQTHIRIHGKVVDRTSGTPLPYANISVKNSAIGTVSNESGEFEFFVPAGLRKDTLLISYIGYKTYKAILSGVNEAEIFSLTEAPTVLNEITVSGDYARKLVEAALDAIPVVYPTAPYLMEGFHRSWEKIDFTDSISQPGTLIEAAVTIYDPGYDQKSSRRKASEEIYINEIRRSAMTEGFIHGRGNTLEDLLGRNLVKYNRTSSFVFLKSFLDFPNDMIYEWEGTTSLDGEDLSVIRIEVPNSRQFPAVYKVYISEEDHAILRFELTGVKKEIDYAIGPWHTEYFTAVYIFRRYRQKPYLHYIKKQYTIKNLDCVKKKVLRTEDYYRELLINNVITTGVDEKRNYLSGKKAKEVSLALQVGEYNEDFWKVYNVVMENPLDKEISRYFEEKANGNDVFRENKVRNKKR